ncbi:cell wall surface anchor family protein, partial [Listeria seeligeri FSL S4-171]
TKITPKEDISSNRLNKAKKLPGTGDANNLLWFTSGVLLLFMGEYLRRKSAK